ncbi:AAA ATPase [Sphingomonas sp. LH128]|uniref:hypothetical protein n=1 Tax=Sphingomonas sp. LH128 TaxID=473781 RepID=UPI00027C9CC1|nr:hypothetical protein [Sphingomonas sp. LH128]EJU10113.1 AAA ATPase [Sphingomonas sp. LH128]
MPTRISATSPDEALDWLHSEDDILDGTDVLAVTSPDDGSEWLVLTGFETYRTTGLGINCEAWRRVASVVVRAADRDAILGLLAQVHLQGHGDLPSAEGGGLGTYLGEFPWGSTATHHSDWQKKWKPFGIDRSFGRGVDVLPTTAEYTAEAGGYDGSLEDNLSLHMPARWLMEALGIHLGDGRAVKYRDAQGQTLFMDPSLETPGRSVALVDRKEFLACLEREGLVAIWGVSGEKNAYGETGRDGFGGRYTYTRLYYSEGSAVHALDRLVTSDEPSPDQLAAFRGEAPSEVG